MTHRSCQVMLFGGSLLAEYVPTSVSRIGILLIIILGWSFFLQGLWKSSGNICVSRGAKRGGTCGQSGARDTPRA